MISARSTAVAGLLGLLLVVPAAAQSTGPTDSGVQRNDQSVRTEPSPPAAESQRAREPRVEPPARAGDDFEPPPAGCRYRDNKLDLIV